MNGFIVFALGVVVGVGGGYIYGVLLQLLADGLAKIGVKAK